MVFEEKCKVIIMTDIMTECNFKQGNRCQLGWDPCRNPNYSDLVLCNKDKCPIYQTYILTLKIYIIKEEKEG